MKAIVHDGCIIESSVLFRWLYSSVEDLMSLRTFKRIQLVIVASRTDGFARVMRSSQVAERKGMNVIPLQCQDEVRSALAEQKQALIVFDSKEQREHDLTPEQEELVLEILSCGGHWCSLKFYEGLQAGFANIHSLYDVLEWIHWNENSFWSQTQDLLFIGIQKIAALILGIMLFPVLMLIALGVKITSPGPVFFKQIRVGYQGKTFVLVKFRTMHLSAEDAGPQWCLGNTDPRLFRFGKLLRETHLDELPQLWNILRGDLCFVGPRPERPEFHKILKEHIPHFEIRSRVRPGLTGWAQLRAGYAASIEESRKKVAHDLYFIRTNRMGLVLSIIMQTIRKCFYEIVAAIVSRVFVESVESPRMRRRLEKNL